MKKVLLITEYLNPPYDEGIKKTVYNLYNELNNKYNLQVISRHAFKDDNIHIVSVNALFLSIKVLKIINDFNPDTLIYFPFASGTFASYLRLKIFSLFANQINTIFIALQPKPLKQWQKFIVRLFLKPKNAITPSPTLKNLWDSIHVKNQLLPLLTDLSVFKSLTNLRLKSELRKKYNLPEKAFIISHMGHLNEGRNLKSLIPLQNSNTQVVIVGSSSTPKDSIGPKSLKKELEQAGIIIIDKYINKIEEIYQLSDLYIFPVVAKNSSIGMPLSILEARACGIPVVTTNYGSIKEYLNSDNENIVYSEPTDFAVSVEKCKNTSKQSYTTRIKELNEIFYKKITLAIEN